MAYVKNLFNTNFMEYASYVIKDRAIPHLSRRSQTRAAQDPP
jgi:DNA gyrase/topoisomerase IV subunit A